MKKQKHVIVTISLCAFLIILSNHLISQSTKEQQLTKEQIEAFRSAETVRIVVEQSYQDDENKLKKNVNPILEALVGEWFKFFGLQVLSSDAKNYDLEIKIKTKSIEYTWVGEGFIRPGKLEYSISFEIKDIPIYARNNKVEVLVGHYVLSRANLELIKEYRTILSEDRDLYYFMRRVEFQIIHNLGKIFGISSVIDRLKDKNAAVRRCAAMALGMLRDPSAIDSLIAALKDEDKDVRVVVVEALRYFYYIYESRIVEPLIACLKDEDEDKDVRVAVITTLIMLEDPRAVERAVEPLIAALKDKDKDIRVAAAVKLRSSWDPRTVEPLIACLKDEDEDKDVRVAAAGSLGFFMKDPRAVEPLIEALKDEDKHVRETAASSLGGFKDPRAVKPLIEALKDEDKHVRVTAAWSLGDLKDPRAVEPLIEALKDEDKDIRRSIVDSLQRITSYRLYGNQKTWQEWWEKNKEKFIKKR